MLVEGEDGDSKEERSETVCAKLRERDDDAAVLV